MKLSNVMKCIVVRDRGEGEITKAIMKAPVIYFRIHQNQERTVSSFVRGSNNGLCVCMFILHVIYALKTMYPTHALQ